MSKEVSSISYDKEIGVVSKYEHYSVGFHNTFGDIRSLHVRLTPLVEFAMNGVHVDRAHGINGATPEDTMRNMGLIVSPGMTETE